MKPNPKVKHSSFFITISTNVAPEYQSDLQSVGKALNEAMESMLSEDNLKEIVKFLPGHEKDKYNDVVEAVDGSFAVELGKKARGGRVHGHALVHIDHRSKIHLDRDEIQSFIKLSLFVRGIDLKSIYVHIDAAKSDRTLIDYISKSPLKLFQ